MDIRIWILIAAVVAVAAYYLVNRKKGETASSGADVDETYNWAASEFKRSFGDERVASVIGDKEMETFFMRLIDGKVGIYRSRRGRKQAIIVEQGDYRLRALPEANGLQVDYPEVDFFSGNYLFRSEQDAADVSTWMLNAR